MGWGNLFPSLKTQIFWQMRRAISFQKSRLIIISGKAEPRQVEGGPGEESNLGEAPTPLLILSFPGPGELRGQSHPIIKGTGNGNRNESALL